MAKKDTASQNAIIRALLLEGKTITTYQAFVDYHITRLPSRICDIRQGNDGHEPLPVHTEMIWNEDGTHYGLNYLDKDYLNAYRADKEREAREIANQVAHMGAGQLPTTKLNVSTNMVQTANQLSLF